MLGLFITGTGTAVGKTHIAALIARQLVAAGKKVGVYKPVASGCRVVDDRLVSDDALVLWHAAGKPLALDDVCPQRFAAPVAPNIAAREEDQTVDVERLAHGLDIWAETSDIVLVEGAGGLMSPLADDYFNADLAHDLGLPVVIVAPNRLGVINDTLQTVITASVFRDGLIVAGVLLNNMTSDGDESRMTNHDELERHLVPPLLGEVHYNGKLPKIDWCALAGQLS